MQQHIQQLCYNDGNCVGDDDDDDDIDDIDDKDNNDDMIMMI